MINLNKILNGFTLSETLIVLVIIGVIAAITIPNIIVDHQKEQTLSRLKKVYSELAQTTNLAIPDNGPVTSWTVTNDSEAFAQTYLLPYLNVAKNCEYNTTGDCDFKFAYLYSPRVYNSYPAFKYRFVLADGAVVFVWTLSVESGNLAVSFANIDVDINGAKGPNRLGRDAFQFVYWMRNSMNQNEEELIGKFIPTMATSSRDDIKSDCNKQNGDGYSCAALIMHDSWEIKRDYPW